MLYNTSKKLLIVTIPFLFTGCFSLFNSGDRTYNSSSYAYKKHKQTASNTKMRNSKAMHRATMRPYVVFGKKYYPTVAHVNDRFTGIASWYGPKFHAKKQVMVKHIICMQGQQHIKHFQ